MRHSPRVYVQFGLDELNIPLPKETAHHLVHVLRLSSGDSVNIFNELAGEWAATLDVRKNGCAAQRRQCLRTAERRKKQVWLAFSPLKPNVTHVVVEKATELDVTHLQPVIMERTQGRGWLTDKWKRVAVEAAQQCERLDVPEIHEPLHFDEFLEQKSPVEWFTAMERCQEAPQLQKPAGSWGVIIGPEGGFSESERARLLASTQAMSLGKNILRAETAAIVSLATLMF